MMESFPPDIAHKRQRIHRLLRGIIVMTFPCYACGIILLIGFAPRGPVLPETPQGTEMTVLGPSETPVPSEPPTASYTPGGPTVTLPATPTQFFPPTITSTSTITLTPTETGTSVPTITAPATITIPPTGTSTSTPTPTNTSVPTLTPTNTLEPTELSDDDAQTATVEALLTQAALDLTATAEAGGGGG